MNRRLWLAVFVALTGVASLAGCGGGGGDGAPAPSGPPTARTSTVSFQRDVLPILRTSCAVQVPTGGCHVGATPRLAPMSLEDNDAYQALVNVASTNVLPGTPRVAPGNSAGSVLFAAVSTDQMPPPAVPGSPAPLTAAQKATIKGWIDQGAFQDLNLRLTGFAPHLGQTMELRIVERQSPRRLKARVILNGLPSADFNLFLPAAVPPGEHDLDFFADFSQPAGYNFPGDHAWRLNIPSTGQVAFAHAANFTDIGATAGTENLDFTLNVTAAQAHANQLWEVRVIKISSGETVGAYRLDVNKFPSTGNFTFRIPGIIESGQDYQVDFFADFTQNGAYDFPGDHAWRLTGTATSSGLSLDFTHNTSFTDIQLTGAPQVASRGTVEGFGSVFVNGVEFRTNTSTRFKVDDNPSAAEDNLRVGMVVAVKGTIDPGGATGTATEVEFENSLEGPITDVNLAGGAISVMGRTVKLNDLTILDGLSLGTTDFAPGVMVEVSGIEQADGTVLARRIERKAAGDNEIEVRGRVSSVAGSSFTLGGLTVNFTPSVLDAAITAAGGLTSGMFVEVKSGAAPVGGALTATRIDLEDDGVPEGVGQEVRIEGLVTVVTSKSTTAVSDFEVEGHRVTAIPGAFRRGSADDLAVGRSVEVEGMVGSGGVLVAREVSFQLARNIKIEGEIQALDDVTQTATILGVQVRGDASTIEDDQSQATTAFAPGDFVSVRAFRDPATGDVVAAKVVRRDRRNTVILQGPADISGTTVTMLGRDVSSDLTTLGAANQLRNAAGAQIDMAGFLSEAVQPNRLVKLRGTQAAQGGPIVWERAEIELSHEFENEVENELRQELEIGVESSGGAVLSATLDGAQVVAVPPVQTPATGTGTVIVSADRTSIQFTLQVSGIATAIQATHIHSGAAGVEGPVIFNLPAPTSGGPPVTGTLTETSGFNAGAGVTFAAAVDAILSGSAYFQVHTAAFPGGELRGQIR